MKKFFTYRIIIVTILMMGTLTGYASMPEYPFIVLSGSETMEVKPDKVFLSIRISAFSKKSDDAYQSVYDAVESIMNILDKYGMTKENVTSYNIGKTLERAENPNQRYQDLEILGYYITQRLKIEIDDINAYPDISEELLTLDNLSNFSPEFKISEIEKFEAVLLKSAGEKAKRKAKIMAKSIGVELKQIQAVEESDGFHALFAGFIFGERSVFRESLTDNRYALESSKSEREKVFIPKTIEISKSVDIVYRIK